MDHLCRTPQLLPCNTVGECAFDAERAITPL